jgi:hypothetical protein
MKRIFISARFVVLRNFSQRDTFSWRSAYPGYIWATLEVAISRGRRITNHPPSRGARPHDTHPAFFRHLGSVEGWPPLPPGADYRAAVNKSSLGMRRA